MKWGKGQRVTSKGYKVSLRADENALKLQIMVMAVQFPKYSESQWIVSFK